MSKKEEKEITYKYKYVMHFYKDYMADSKDDMEFVDWGNDKKSLREELKRLCLEGGKNSWRYFGYIAEIKEMRRAK